MSLILEALRKSEAERRRGSAPDVALELPPVPARGRRAAPGWLWPLIAAIALLLVLAWWPGSRPAVEATAPDADAQATASAEPAPVATPAPLPTAPAVVPRRREPPAVAATPTAPQTVAQRPVAATASASISTHTPAPEPRPEPPPPGDDTPDIRATSLPPVKLSMHMWDPSPARRFVILDGRRMAEGDSLGGLQVVAIERDGVVVERDGQRAKVRLP